MSEIEPMSDGELANVCMRHREYGISPTSDEVAGLLARLDAAEAERDEYKLQMHAACADVDVLTHQRDRLQAVVDRLPKTADGVPVVPGMILHSSTRPGYTTTSDHAVFYDEWYSTREAALAATKGDR